MPYNAYMIYGSYIPSEWQNFSGTWAFEDVTGDCGQALFQLLGRSLGLLAFRGDNFKTKLR